MRVNCSLVQQHAVLLGPVCDGHDIDVIKIRAALAPVAVSEHLVPANLTARLHLAARRHRPVEKRIEARDTHSGLRGLHVLKEGRKTTNHFALLEALCCGEELVHADTRLRRPRNPRVRSDFRNFKLTLQSKKHLPIQITQIDALNGHHLRGHFNPIPRLDGLSPDVPHAECKDAFGRHQLVLLAPRMLHQHLAMLIHRGAHGYLQSGPKPVLRAFGLLVG